MSIGLSSARALQPADDFPGSVVAEEQFDNLQFQPESLPRPTLRKTGVPSSVPWARGTNWVVGLAAAVLLLVSIGGYLFHRGQLQQIAAGHMRLRVTGPSNLQAGVEARYAVDASTINGDPLSAQVRYAVYAPGDKDPKWHNETTGEDGRFEIALGDEPLPAHTVLKVVAQRKGAEQTEEEVRLLVDQMTAPGEHRIEWDLRDEGGRELPAGIYRCYIEAGGERSYGDIEIRN